MNFPPSQCHFFFTELCLVAVVFIVYKSCIQTLSVVL